MGGDWKKIVGWRGIRPKVGETQWNKGMWQLWWSQPAAHIQVVFWGGMTMNEKVRWRSEVNEGWETYKYPTYGKSEMINFQCRELCIRDILMIFENLLLNLAYFLRKNMWPYRCGNPCAFYYLPFLKAYYHTVRQNRKCSMNDTWVVWFNSRQFMELPYRYVYVWAQWNYKYAYRYTLVFSSLWNSLI